MLAVMMRDSGRSGRGWVEEHRRGVCSRKGEGAHAIEHSECAGGDIQLRGARGVGAHVGLHGFALGGAKCVRAA